jgi:hypothetical protein
MDISECITRNLVREFNYVGVHIGESDENLLAIYVDEIPYGGDALVVTEIAKVIAQCVGHKDLLNMSVQVAPFTETVNATFTVHYDFFKEEEVVVNFDDDEEE